MKKIKNDNLKPLKKDFMNTFFATLMLVAVGLFTSCQETLTAEQQQQVEALQQQIDADRAQADAAQKDAQLHMGEYKAATTDEQRAAALNAFQSSLQQFQNASADYKEKTTQQDAIIQQSAKDAAGPILGIAKTYFPGFGWIGDLLTAVGIPLVFKRSREHLFNGIKDIGKLDIGGFILSLARTYGLKHTTDDPIQIVENAASAARAKNDHTLASNIQVAANILDAGQTPVPSTPVPAV